VGEIQVGGEGSLQPEKGDKKKGGEGKRLEGGRGKGGGRKGFELCKLLGVWFIILDMIMLLILQLQF
jgi:hypothetical protein